MGFKVGFADAFRLGIDFAYEKERFQKANMEFEVFDCYTEDDILTDILDCELFILDDLGAETLSSYSLGIMYNIVNTRMIQNRPTIYTTNIASQNELSKRYGEKISSRILGTCVFLNFFGKDIRLIKSKRI